VNSPAVRKGRDAIVEGDGGARLANTGHVTDGDVGANDRLVTRRGDCSCLAGANRSDEQYLVLFLAIGHFLLPKEETVQLCKTEMPND
jgi:hypothetical protein